MSTNNTKTNTIKETDELGKTLYNYRSQATGSNLHALITVLKTNHSTLDKSLEVLQGKKVRENTLKLVKHHWNTPAEHMCDRKPIGAN